MTTKSEQLPSGPASNRILEELVRFALHITFKPGGLLQQYMEPYPFRTQPTTLTSLLKMDPVSVGMKLEGMIRNPQTTAQGIELLGRYRVSMDKRQEAPDAAQ